MSLSLQNICVFIKDEKQLQEAIKLLSKYNQSITPTCYIEKNASLNFLYFSENKQAWTISFRIDETIITLTKLEKLLEDANN